MLGCHLVHEHSERMLVGDSSQRGGKIELVKLQADPLPVSRLHTFAVINPELFD